MFNEIWLMFNEIRLMFYIYLMCYRLLLAE